MLGWLVFGVNPLVMLFGLALALLLANVAARATGETDFSPGGPVGTIGVMATASRGTVSGLLAGTLCMGMTSQTSQTLWAFRAGHRLGASPRAQVGAQILGVIVGAIVTIPVYAVIASQLRHRQRQDARDLGADLEGDGRGDAGPGVRCRGGAAPRVSSPWRSAPG